MTADSVILKCENCETLNRVPKEKLNSGPICGKCKHPLSFPKQPVDIGRESFEKEVKEQPGIVLLEFWSPQCVHCMEIAPVIDELAREKAGMLKIARINVLDNGEMARHFDVRGTPTFVLFRDGEKIDRIDGAPPAHELREWIETKLQ